ncbi:MAG: glycoside hydrolase family 3 protein [Actinobacteria bacterium]|nr:glycoside hydrolase family 3 protein [Actinomycetota bacterium]
MSKSQRIGQLFMVGASSTGPDQRALAAVAGRDVGSVFLMGTSQLSAPQVAALVAPFQAAAGTTRLFVATDQEGGSVQRLQGPGFSSIPSALDQGRLPASALQQQAQAWAAQLATAGVNLNLAPVLDTVPNASFAPNNPPIGALDREFGFDPAQVGVAGSAVVRGYEAAGVDATIKHFPGLGRVTGNTDTSAHVVDNDTTATDAALAPFQAAIEAGAPFVMMSLAVYARIDASTPAAFSSVVIGTMLRKTLGFQGVVISDDLGATAEVRAIPPGQRALEFIAAGGDMVLTVDAGLIPEMVAAVSARTQSDPVFAAQVDAAALRVLQAKQARGLLG